MDVEDLMHQRQEESQLTGQFVSTDVVMLDD